jgi:hypothetical protein
LDRQQHQLFIHSKDGRYVNKIEEGGAPNNSRDLRDFTTSKKGSLWINSYQAFEKFTEEGVKISRYPVDTELKEGVNPINPIQMGYSSGSFYLWGGSVGFKASDLRKTSIPTMIRLVDSETQGSFKISEGYFPLRRGLVDTDRFIEYKDTLFLTTFLESDTIHSAYKGVVRAEYVVDFGNQSYSHYPSINDDKNEESSIRYDITYNTNLCGQVRKPVLTKDHIAFQYVGPGPYVFQAICDRKTLHATAGTGFGKEKFPFIITGQYNEKFIAYANSEQLAQYFAAYSDKSKSPLFLNKNWDILSKGKGDDNPVILLLKMKPF